MPLDRDEKCISTHGAGVVCIISGKVLLVQLNYGAFKGHWILPGGMMENDEHPHVTAVREFKEETNLNVIIKNLLTVRHRLSQKVNNTYWVFTGELVDSFTLEKLSWNPAELQDVKFWDLEECFSDPLVRPNTKHFIQLATSSQQTDLFYAAKSEFDDMLYLGAKNA